MHVQTYRYACTLGAGVGRRGTTSPRHASRCACVETQPLLALNPQHRLGFGLMIPILRSKRQVSTRTTGLPPYIAYVCMHAVRGLPRLGGGKWGVSSLGVLSLSPLHPREEDGTRWRSACSFFETHRGRCTSKHQDDNCDGLAHNTEIAICLGG